MNSNSTLLKEILAFILIATVMGTAAQFVLPNGISLFTKTMVIESDSGIVAIPVIAVDPSGNGDVASNIPLNEAYLAHQNGTALFLDARSHDEYEAGHIFGAVNLPAHALMDSLPYLENLNPNRLIITYCDGADCNASIDLAANLKLMDFPKVAYFFGGWQEWIDAGYPIAGNTNE